MYSVKKKCIKQASVITIINLLQECQKATHVVQLMMCCIHTHLWQLYKT